MSGGSHDYLYLRIEEFIDIEEKLNLSPLRRRFAEHLKDIALAMKDIEWVESGDMSPGDEDKAIKKCLEEK